VNNDIAVYEIAARRIAVADLNREGIASKQRVFFLVGANDGAVTTRLNAIGPAAEAIQRELYDEKLAVDRQPVRIVDEFGKRLHQTQKSGLQSSRLFEAKPTNDFSLGPASSLAAWLDAVEQRGHGNAG